MGNETLLAVESTCLYVLCFIILVWDCVDGAIVPIFFKSVETDMFFNTQNSCFASY